IRLVWSRVTDRHLLTCIDTTRSETDTWALGNLAGVASFAATLLRCEDLRARLAATCADAPSSSEGGRP
ncbi:MAG TPA: hypothetical protein PKW35_06745, partial [Nannocystaceae bacterium]|nr:hypothetical protein [Nannocystaceae bacterium]